MHVCVRVCVRECVHVHPYVTVSEKTDHLAQVSDFDIFTLCNGEVRIAVAYTVLELRASRYRHPRNAEMRLIY